MTIQRNGQRGSATGYLAICIVIALALAALIVVWNHYTDGLIEEGYNRGVGETEAEYAKRDNAALHAKQKRIDELEAAARGEEQRKAKAVAIVSANYERKLSDAISQKDRDIADARSGALGLRYIVPGPSKPRLGCGGQTGSAPAGASERDGETQAELPREITADLYALAADADQIVEQLSACQAVVLADREQGP